MARHFPYKHPTFGTKHRPKPEGAWKQSVYYWWWQYLKRNVDYIRTCERGGKGKCSKLYADFGDVSGDDFKAWWSEGSRSVHCFAEPPTPTLQILEDGNISEISSKGMLVLSVPLNIPLKHLAGEFRKIVSKRHPGKRGVRHSTLSQARYPVTGKVDLVFLEDALKVWDDRQADPNKPLWKIAQDLQIVPSKHWVRDDDTIKIAAAKKNVMAATASRLLRKATAIIANVGNGRFPDSRQTKAGG